MPPDDRLGLNEGEGVSPAAPQSVQEDPDQPVGGSEAWARRGTPEDGQLVAQGEVLKYQDAVGPDAAEEAGEDQGKHGSHHPGRPARSSMVARRTE